MTKYRSPNYRKLLLKALSKKMPYFFIGLGEMLLVVVGVTYIVLKYT